MFLKEILQDRLSEKVKNISPLSGGDINDVYKIKTQKNTYVLKVNEESDFPMMFVHEKQALISLGGTGVKTPQVIHTFEDSGKQFLVLEFIEEENINADFWRNFALDLTKIHSESMSYFGLEYNNYIGSLRQDNSPEDSWEDFFIRKRIQPLTKQAYDLDLLNSDHIKRFENLFSSLKDILPKEKSSLLHGDLWYGNLMCTKDQTPVFIDPAIYYGNREMDIAMTRMFGGFDNSFIHDYNDLLPMENNWEERIQIHNLYPNLVHLQLFGKSYLSGIERVIRQF